MASEERTNGALSIGVPADVGDWIDEQADRRGESPASFCRHLLTAIHAVAEDPAAEPIDRATLEGLRAEVDGARERAEESREEVEGVREEFLTLLEDVRGRVVQVKRETDAKAAADHEHPSHASETALESVRADLEALEERTDAGFETVEDLLAEDLTARRELEERASILARAVLDLREHRDALLERDRRRREAERLQRAANRLGIRRADCEACDASVTVALLAEPACPHCETLFADVRARTSLFGSHTLVTGEPPALEGRVEDAAADADVEAAAEPLRAETDERDPELEDDDE